MSSGVGFDTAEEGGVRLGWMWGKAEGGGETRVG